MDQLDNVIRVVNNHENDNYQVGQAMQDMQQAVDTLRQTVESWNDDYPQSPQILHEEQEEQPGDLRQDLSLEEKHDDASTVASSQVNPPPGLSATSMTGSASTIIVSALEMPLFKGKKTSVCT